MDLRRHDQRDAKKLSQNGKSPLATEPQECARKLQQSDVVRRLFVVAYQNSTALGEPCYSPFHNPPARRIPLAPRTVQLLLADASDVWPIAVSGDGSTTRRIVIPLVQAQVLWVILGELRTFDHNRLQGLIQQRGVVGVGSGNHNAQWAALSFHKQAPLAASLAAIRWVGSNQIPPKRALPMAPSAACHSQSTPPNSSHCSTKALHIRRKTVPPTVERCDGLCCRPPVLSAIGSIGTRCASGMMPLSICLGSARLRPLTLGGSASKMIGPMSSQSSSDASHMVSKPSWLFTNPPNVRNHTNHLVNRSRHLCAILR